MVVLSLVQKENCNLAARRDIKKDMTTFDADFVGGGKIFRIPLTVIH